jgi:putative ABC transport system permease protein
VTVSPNYLRTLGIPLVRGRDLAAEDRADSAGVALVSQRMARRYWSGGDPIGQRIRFETDSDRNRWFEIVGVVADVRNADASAEPNPLVYVSASQFPNRTMVAVVRTRGADPSTLVADVRRQMLSVDKDQPIYEVLTMEQILAEDLQSTAVLASILAAVALVALVLAAVGIYGVVAQSVSQRTHEIGIRLALGAQRWAALRLVLAQAAVPVLAGAAIGVGSGLGLMRFTATALKGVIPSDMAYGSVLLFVAAITFMAMYIPARRATVIDPAEALRLE